MRRFAASAATIVVFVAYALGQRFLGTPNTTVGTATPTVGPSSTQTVNTNAASGSGLPSTQTSGAAPNPGALLRNGTFIGGVASNQWGQVQVQVTVSGGHVTNVQALQYPTERRRSASINSQAVPILQSEAIQAQSANVNIVSGATLTSEGFQQSLQSALSRA
jgi:uncharacterized protein with FMN-binding domain